MPPSNSQQSSPRSRSGSDTSARTSSPDSSETSASRSPDVSPPTAPDPDRDPDTARSDAQTTTDRRYALAVVVRSDGAAWRPVTMPASLETALADRDQMIKEHGRSPVDLHVLWWSAERYDV